MRPLVVIGQAPGRAADPGAAVYTLAGRCGTRLAELMSLDLSTYLAATERHNLLDKWPGACGSSDAFPIAHARKRASMIAPCLHGRRVIMLGQGVRRAFGMPECELLAWHTYDWHDGLARFDAAVVPHPSGINRWWNDPANEAAARAFLHDAARRA